MDGTFVPYSGDSGLGDSVGEFAYTLSGMGPADSVELFFSPFADPPVGDDTYSPFRFNISNIQYGTDITDMPEPGTWMLGISGLALMEMGRRKRVARSNY